MDGLTEIVTKLGLAVSLALVVAWLLMLLIKWLMGEFTKKIDDLHSIIIKLIDKINRLNDDIVVIAGKMRYDRKEIGS